MATLYRKYRPTVWADVVGQEHVKLTLAQEIASGSIAHAYLFSGPRGVGKTTAARIFARGVNCEKVGVVGGAAVGEPCGECKACMSILDGRALDIVEIDAASHRGIEMVRETIVEGARFSPVALKYKVFIIDEVHMLSNDAWNALLKTLEEPPSHALFVLATTEMHKVPATVVSRCERFVFRRIADEAVRARLVEVAEKEGRRVVPEVFAAIVRLADGGLRDAESLLGQVLAAAGDGEVTAVVAETVLPVVGSAHAREFMEALVAADAGRGFAAVAAAREAGGDALRLLDEVTVMLRERMLAAGKDAAVVGMCARILAKVVEARQSARFLSQQFLAAELVVGELCGTTPSVAVASSVPVAVPAVVSTRPKETPVVEVPKEKEPELVLPQPAQVSAVVDEVPRRVDVDPNAPPVVPLTSIAAKWGEFSAKAGTLQATLSFVLGVARPVGVYGNVVRLGFTFEFHKDKCNEERNRQPMEKVLSAIFGVPLQIEGVLLEKNAEVVHTVNADPFEAAMAASSAPAAGPMAADALADAFGGKVVG